MLSQRGGAAPSTRIVPGRRRAPRVAIGLVVALSATGCQVDRPASTGPPGAPSAARGEASSVPPVASFPTSLGDGSRMARPSPSGTFFNIVIDHNVAVPMRDGVVLRADLYRPAGAGRFPTLVYRTPYGKDDLLTSGSEPTLSRAAHAGYAVLVQDVRGRYNSEGEFRPYQQEGRDGYDTVEWAAAQPWSNGRVGTFGLSYPGAAQWLLAMETPPHLVAIFPAMTFATGRHFFHFGGAWNHDWMRWVELYIAPDVRRRKNLPGARTEEAATKEWERRKWDWERYQPSLELPLLKSVAPWYYEWLQHPDDGSYWEFADVTGAHARMNVPALNFSAWYDSAYGPLGAIANFNGMREHAATPEARRGQRLILGPWTHGDPSESRTRVGELDMGPSATLDYYGLILAWHDRWLKGIRNGIDEGAPVRIFVMGENVWRDEDAWPLARARPTDYYFRGGGRANTAAGDGRLATEAPGDEPADHYTYDPGRPVVIQNFETQGPFDHASLQARRDVLVYTGEPLARDLEVTGPIAVHLWAATSAVDTDFAVMLCDVAPDGKAYNLAPLESGYLRARYRNSESRPEMMTPGAPTELIIGGMVTSNLFRAGHRIRIQVTSSRFPNFDRNPNTGQRPERAVGGIAAHQTIFHDAGHPSRVVLPVVPRF